MRGNHKGSAMGRSKQGFRANQFRTSTSPYAVLYEVTMVTGSCFSKVTCKTLELSHFSFSFFRWRRTLSVIICYFYMFVSKLSLCSVGMVEFLKFIIERIWGSFRKL